MATINNSDTIKRIIDDAKIQTSLDAVPNQLASKVVPVLVANPEPQLKVKGITASDDAAEVIFTTSTVKRTFITLISITTSKDANSDSLFSDVTGVPLGGSSTGLCRIRYEPLTAGYLHKEMNFGHGFELEKGSNLTLTNNTATASIDSSALVVYYEVED